MIVAIGAIPLFLFLILIVRGLFTADTISITHANYPQWQLEIGSYWTTQLISVRMPDPAHRWRDTNVPTFAHLSYEPEPGWPGIDPTLDLYHFAGFREVHFRPISQPTDYHNLYIPTWMTLFVFALPMVPMIFVKTDGKRCRFALRVISGQLLLCVTWLCLLSILIWARSYDASDILHVQSAGRARTWQIVCGQISIESQPIRSERPYVALLHQNGYWPSSRIHTIVEMLHGQDTREFRFIDFEYAHLHEPLLGKFGPTWTAAIPIWSITLVLAIWPILWLRKRIWKLLDKSAVDPEPRSDYNKK